MSPKIQRAACFQKMTRPTVERQGEQTSPSDLNNNGDDRETAVACNLSIFAAPRQFCPMTTLCQITNYSYQHNF